MIFNTLGTIDMIKDDENPQLFSETIKLNII